MWVRRQLYRREGKRLRPLDRQPVSGRPDAETAHRFCRGRTGQVVHPAGGYDFPVSFKSTSSSGIAARRGHLRRRSIATQACTIPACLCPRCIGASGPQSIDQAPRICWTSRSVGTGRLTSYCGSRWRCIAVSSPRAASLSPRC
jgi:hypothetical protein